MSKSTRIFDLVHLLSGQRPQHSNPGSPNDPKAFSHELTEPLQ